MSLDQIRGLLIGVALGDTLGAPHEFRYSVPLDKYTGSLYLETELKQRFQPVRTLKIGQITDDTEMTITLARSIIKNKGYNQTNTTLEYMKWANTPNTVFMGKNTRQLFKNVTTINGYKKRYGIATNIPINDWSQSNGALMRCSILAILNDVNAVELDCAITNPHTVNIKCNQIYVNIIRKILLNKENELSLDNLYNNATDPEIKTVIKQVIDKTERDIRYNKGWCLHGLYCALYTYFHFDTFGTMESALKWTIQSHPKSDTDTNGAIVGAIIGAKLGLAKIKTEDIMKNNIDIILQTDVSISSGANVPRPIEYTLSDFDNLTDKLHKIYLSKNI